MAFRMKRLQNEKKWLASAVAKQTIISAKWASDSSSVEVNIVLIVILISPKQVEHDAGGPFGILRTKVDFPHNYPTCPPTMQVLDDICHPNVYRQLVKLPRFSSTSFQHLICRGSDGITSKGSVCMRQIKSLSIRINYLYPASWTFFLQLASLLSTAGKFKSAHSCLSSMLNC